MGERRALVEGVTAADEGRRKEAAFVFQEAAGPAMPAAPHPAPQGRARLTTQVRADYAAALKRASLERQLAGVVPNQIQEMLEEALGPWLKDHGYLP